ncbi:ERCC4 domain-containing protein [Marinobacter salicampi]|uniref:ERCC4 domain-containing protein n=1 Tax=Marinobacter salicampi TaxID=435907 RepID=UPI00140BC93E|nr:ERCC4 domain-containing protein [Marinobacter salicampi]
MPLNYWQSPQNPALSRLYVSAKAFKQLPELDAKEVKIWIEPSASAMAGWVLKAKGDVSALGKGLMFNKRVIEALGINASLSWGELVQQYGNKPNKPGRKPRGSGAGQSTGSPFGAKSVLGDQPGARAYEALNLDIPSIKMVGPVTIQVDHRETEALADLLASHPMITVESVSLALGDIEVVDAEGNRLLIERKRCDASATKTDFEVSIQDDGRLFDQSERLKMAVGASDRQVIPIILLEGDVYGHSSTMLCQQIDGAISFLAVIQRVSVLPVYNLNHSAYMIAKLASHFVHGLFTPISLHKTKPTAIWDQQRYVLEALPGVSSKVAEILLAEFGSVRKVMSASRKELLAVKGLGQKKVDGLLEVLDGVSGEF